MRLEALDIEDQAGIGSYHVVVAQKPQVEQQDGPEQTRLHHHDETAEKGEGSDPQNKGEIEGGVSQPAVRWDGLDRFHSFLPSSAPFEGATNPTVSGPLVNDDTR